ncbi:MAG: hypothetical protein GY711_22985 [bacterium]|nr:hypothetical protein [bacterium]
MRSTLLFVLAVALALALWRLPGATDDNEASVPTSSLRRPTPEGEALDTPLALPGASDPVRAHDVATGVRVYAVEWSSRRPLAGATVWSAPLATVRARAGSDPNLEWHARKIGRRQTTDETGAVRVTGSSVQLVWAEMDGWYGRTELDPGAGGEVLLLQCSRKPRIDVLVLDARGAPAAGVRVRAGADFHRACEQRVTDARGLARFERTPRRGAEAEDRHRFFVADVLSRELVGTEIDLAAEREEPYTIQLPPTSRVHVIAEDERGHAADLVAASLAVRSTHPAARSFFTEKPTGPGGVTFERVALGLQLRARVEVYGVDKTAEVSFTGPRRGDTTRTVRVPVESPLGWWLHIRGPAGRLPEGTVWLRVLKEDEKLYGRALPVGERDVVFAPTPRSVAPGETCRIELRYDPSHDDDAHIAGWFGTRLAKVPGPNELVDLGTIVLAPEPAPLVVGGRLVDANRRPVAGADVLVIDYGPDRDWTAAPDLVTATDTQGSFQVRGHSGALRAPHVAFRHRTHTVSEPVPFEPGASDLVVRVDDRGSVRGRLMIPAGLPAARLWVRSAGDGDWDMPMRSNVMPDGTFHLRNLPLGPVALSVGATGCMGPLCELGTVDVRAGEVEPLAFDLRERIRVIELDVRRPGGDVPAAGYVVHRPRDGGRLRGWSFAHGYGGLRRGDDLTLITAEAASDLEVHVPGCIPVHLSGVRGAIRIELTPGPRIEMRLPPGTATPPRVTLAPEEPPYASRTSFACGRPRVKDFEVVVTFDANGRGSAHVAAPGAYGLSAASSFFPEPVACTVEAQGTDLTRLLASELKSDGRLPREQVFER